MKVIAIKNYFYNKKIVKWIVLLSILVALLKLNAYGFDILLSPGFEKGYDQWDPWTWKKHGLVLANICTFILIPVAAICWTRLRNPILLTPVIIEMIIRIANFSRAFFLPVLFFILVAHLLGSISRKTVILALCLSLLSFGLIIGMRELSRTVGLGTFLQTVLEQRKPTIGLIDAITKSVSVLGKDAVTISIMPENKNLLDGLVFLLKTVSPLPSFLYKAPSYIQLNLAPILGFKENAGIPFSVMGELNYYFGYLGALFGLPYGILAGILEKNLFELNNRNHGYILAYICFVYSLIVSMHSPIRSSTRLFMYMLFFLIFINIMRNFNDRVFRNIA